MGRDVTDLVAPPPPTDHLAALDSATTRSAVVCRVAPAPAAVEPLAVNSAAAASALALRRGHAHEAAGRWRDALRCYDSARSLAHGDSAACRRARALACMNAGNVLRRLRATKEAVRAYDATIALFMGLPSAENAEICNGLGAAWTNRGCALQLARDALSLTEAVASHEQAIAVLAALPRNGPSHYVRNLAGAWLNLADALLGSSLASARARARVAAQTALEQVASRERADAEFAQIALKARRAFVEAVGHLLVKAGGDGDAVNALADAASEAVDSGLALARHWQAQGHGFVRPLAVRLFRFGAQLYRLHQPHFLAEFALETLAPGAFADDAELQQVATEALACAYADLTRPRLFHLGDHASERDAATARDLRAALAQLSAPAAGPRWSASPAEEPSSLHPSRACSTMPCA